MAMDHKSLIEDPIPNTTGLREVETALRELRQTTLAIMNDNPTLTWPEILRAAKAKCQPVMLAAADAVERKRLRDAIRRR
jgi:hypothetical protein